MILKYVRIENFKCIEDSEEFSVAPVTCLVGKNESGKTALLQALYKLNPVVEEERAFDHIKEYPRRHLSDYEDLIKRKPERADNVLTTVWELDQSDLQTLSTKFGSHSIKSNTFTLTKGYDNKLKWSIAIDEKSVVNHYLTISKLDDQGQDGLSQAETIADLMDKLESRKSSEPYALFLRTLQQTFPERDVLQACTTILEQRLPIFVHFPDYEQLPGEVPISLLKSEPQKDLEFKYRVFLALLDLAGTTAEEIDRIGTYEHFAAKLEGVSNRISREIFEYWSQNKHLEVDFRFEHARPGDPPPFNTGYIFRTRIKNRRHGVTVSFDERSSGFVWFFSFLVWFSQAQKSYGDNLIILLDEPALNLHARAQGDFLRYINERLKPKYQVVYTAHSPFLIDPENLLSARTVEDVVIKKEVNGEIEEEIKGTKVGDKVFSSDADTVFPLQAALGYDITQTLFVGKHTLLVEGPSDLLYLKWFSRELQTRGKPYLDQRWVISPSGGIDKIASFLVLFAGKKLHVAVFTDLHKGQKRKVRDLKESKLLQEGHVFSAEMYVAQDEADIEDLLGRQSYIHLVNKTFSLGGPRQIPKTKAPETSIRVLEEAERHFNTLSTDIPEFDHYAPASFLVENTSTLRTSLPGLDEALNRFQKLFTDLNKLLPNQPAEK